MAAVFQHTSTGIKRFQQALTGFPKTAAFRPLTPEPLAARIQEMPIRMAKNKTNAAQIVMFPSGATSTLEIVAPDRLSPPDWSLDPKTGRQGAINVVLSGSYRKDFEGLRRTYEELRDIGCDVLSPSNVIAVSEKDGFVYMQGEETQRPENIENRHLDAIQRASFVWLHSPNGYIGPTAALEIGFANAAGVPVYAKEEPSDLILRSFVRLVGSPAAVVKSIPEQKDSPKPALKAFQEYYRRAALQRGYASEGPKDCLLLMVEEVGELAHALRKREGLARHGAPISANEGQELADVFLYVVHMANVLDLDLASVVRDKEMLNIRRFLAR